VIPLTAPAETQATGDATGLATLRQAGAADFDPVGWHYIEVLSTRISTQQGAARGLLQSKLDTALRDLQARMAAAHHVSLATRVVTPSPGTSPLAQLLKTFAPASSAAALPTDNASTWRADSPQVQQFRQTLSKLRVQKQVAQAIAQGPQNAGPINSHMLVLRSLGLMCELSPDYLNRFMAYVDTLLCLEESGKAKPSTPKTSSKTRSAK
jgi:hypothetical protein